MTSVQEFGQWKKKIEGLQRQADRAAGVLDNLRERLKDLYGCSSVEEAEKLLAKLKKQHRMLKDRLDEQLTAFQKKWGGSL